MTRAEKQRFAEEFLSRYLAHGFSSIPKSEIDLLVFHLLSETTDYREKSNYELATMLQIPESRIKTLRLNSALKYREINSKAILSRVVQRFVASEQFASFESGKVEISLEDPIERDACSLPDNQGLFIRYLLHLPFPKGEGQDN